MNDLYLLGVGWIHQKYIKTVPNTLSFALRHYFWNYLIMKPFLFNQLDLCFRVNIQFEIVSSVGL